MEDDVALKSMPAKEARGRFSELLDDAASGKGTVIYRNSKPAAAVIPPDLADLVPVVQAILFELGESVQLSHDPEILAAYEQAQGELARGEITWYEV